MQQLNYSNDKSCEDRILKSWFYRTDLVVIVINAIIEIGSHLVGVFGSRLWVDQGLDVVDHDGVLDFHGVKDLLELGLEARLDKDVGWAIGGLGMGPEVDLGREGIAPGEKEKKVFHPCDTNNSMISEWKRLLFEENSVKYYSDNLTMRSILSSFFIVILSSSYHYLSLIIIIIIISYLHISFDHKIQISYIKYTIVWNLYSRTFCRQK